ncbi:hypothetical protein BKA63DRAFT_36235 [Paraphoma chrysanthemicola]|nr:hypothetical protein BKA63DRAFT_36235 [Paraphoma chrysanthemicola]
MRSVTQLALVAGAAAQVIEAPFALHRGDILDHPLPSVSKRNTFEPCAEVSQLWAAQVAQLSNPGAAPAQIRVPAKRAYECLLSVPVDSAGDLKEIDELKAYLQYQSTLPWLKAGVKGQIEPLDVLANLDIIADGIKKKSYKSDYDVQLSIRQLLDKAGDFHLQYIPDITNVFQFARPTGVLVSISADGLALPKIYLYSDLPKTATGNIAASAITKINGQNATEVLQKLSEGTKYHDADTRYNTVFPNPALDALGTDSGGLSYAHYVYAGPTTTFTFENGTEKTIDNIAVIPSIFDFKKVSDGASFFKAFCSGPQAVLKPSGSATASATLRATSTQKPVATPTSVGLPGYPTPQFLQSSKKVSGYYLGDSYKDTAVLAIPAFSPSSTDSKYPDSTTGGFIETQALLQKFFAEAVKAGKKKLVIDLRGNGGGTIDMGFELFKQLFPTIEPYGAARYRAHEAFHYYSALVADVALEGDDKDGKIGMDWDDADYGIQSTFLWSNILDKNLQKYKSYKDYYGPQTINGDTFTSIRRYNFSNNLGGHTLSASLTGYNQFKNIKTQPFQSDDIVIIQDGFCGSTCAIFAELMREQGKVQTIAIGGRPQNAPMQGVGGSKGSQRLGMDALYQFAERTIKIAEALDGIAVANKLNQTAVGKIYNAEQIFVRTTPPSAGSLILGAVNSLNNQRMNDSTDTPLEFQYEAADCRLFYTTATYLDPVNMWKAVWEAKWGKGKCVPGSTGDKTAIGVLENKSTFGSKSGGAQQTNANGQPIESTGAASSMSVSSVVATFAAMVALAKVM